MVANELTRPEGELRVLAREGVTGALGLMASGVAATGLAAIASIVIARVLGPGGYGLYVLALTGVSLLQLFAGLGMPSAVTFFSARSRSLRGAVPVLRLGLLVSAASGTLLVALGVLLLPVVNSLLLRAETVNKFAMIALPCVLLVPLFNVLASFFVGIGKAPIAGFISVLKELFRLVALVTVLVVIGLSVTSAVALYTASYAFAFAIALLLVAWLIRGAGEGAGSSSIGARRAVRISSMLSYGLPFYLAGVLAGLVGVSENVLLARISSVEDLAGFRASMNVVTAIGLATGPIFTVALPVFAKVPEGARPSRIYGVSHALALSLVAPLTTLTIVLSKEILAILYGRSFEGFYVFLCLLSLTHLALALGGGLATAVLAGLGRSWLSNLASLTELAILLGLSLLVGRAYGALGVVFAALISRWASAIYSLIALKKAAGLSPDAGKTLRVVLASLVALAFSFAFRLAVERLLSLPLLLAIATGLVHAVSYILVLACLRPFTVHELGHVLLAMEAMGPLYKASKVFVWLYEGIYDAFENIRRRRKALPGR